MKMKLIKVVVVLAVFLGTYALKDFTQFADNVYAACRMVGGVQVCDGGPAHTHDADGLAVKAKAGAAKTVASTSDEEIKRTEIVGDTATVTCGKDTPDSKIDELAAHLKAAGIVNIVVNKEGSKKGGSDNKGKKKKQDEEDYELSASDEDDYVLASAWDEVLAMLRGNPMYAKDFDNPDLSESLEERIDNRIERQVEKSIEAYMQSFVAHLTKVKARDFFDDEKDESDVYFDLDEQKEFIKDVNEKLSEEYNDLTDKGDDMTPEEKVRYRKLHLQLHTLDKLKKAFNRAVRNVEEYMDTISGQSSDGVIWENPGMMPGMPGMDPLGRTQKPETGWGFRLESTPFGGAKFGVDRAGENGDYSINGGYEHIPQKYLEMFGPMGMGAGGFGGGGFGSFNPGAMAGNPWANPSDFMGIGGGGYGQ